MRKINKTAILLVCTLLFTGCAKEDDTISSIIDFSLTDSQRESFENLQSVPLTEKQYRKLLQQELDIDIDSTEYKVRSGFNSDEDVFYGNIYLEDFHVTWPRTFSVAYNNEHKVGFINEDSDIVIQPKYAFASNFNDGVALIEFPCNNTLTAETTDLKLENTFDVTQLAYINEADLLIEDLSKYIGNIFFDGTTTAEDRNDTMAYYEIYPTGENLYGGKEGVTRTGKKGNKLGSKDPYFLIPSKKEYNFLVDESGAIIIDSDEKFLEFQGAGNDYVYGFKNFSKKYISYKKPDRLYGAYDVKFAVLDTQGNPVSKWIDYNIEDDLLMNRYMYDEDVNDGLILIYDTTTEKFGYLSVNGEIAIEPTYTCATKFSEGIACVSDGENYGFINTKGELVIPMKYPILDKEELSFNTENYGMIAVAKIFTNLSSLFRYSCFTEGVCPVRENGKFGLINQNGDYVVAPIFDELSNVTGDIATGRIGNNYYIIEKINKK